MSSSYKTGAMTVHFIVDEIKELSFLVVLMYELQADLSRSALCATQTIYLA